MFAHRVMLRDRVYVPGKSQHRVQILILGEHQNLRMYSLAPAPAFKYHMRYRSDADRSSGVGLAGLISFRRQCYMTRMATCQLT